MKSLTKPSTIYPAESYAQYTTESLLQQILSVLQDILVLLKEQK